MDNCLCIDGLVMCMFLEFYMKFLNWFCNYVLNVVMWCYKMEVKLFSRIWLYSLEWNGGNRSKSVGFDGFICNDSVFRIFFFENC